MKPFTPSEIKRMYHDFNNVKLNNKEKRARGYALEKILYSILFNEKLDPVASYKETGEQIDGSFMWLGQTFLLEAKWHKDPLPASSIYSFKGKVDGKFHTSSGVFISMSGYSDDAADALRFGKVQNIILFDKTDIDVIIMNGISFEEVLKFKVRHAGDTGNPYESFKRKEEVQNLLTKLPVFSFRDDSNTRKSNTSSSNNRPALFIVFGEGKKDVREIELLFRGNSFGEGILFQMVSLEGASNLIRQFESLANEAYLMNDKFEFKGVIAILDEDKFGLEMKRKFEDYNDAYFSRNSIPTPVRVFNIDSERIGKIALGQFDDGNPPRWFSEIKSFIDEQLFDYFDQEEAEARKAIEAEMKRAMWDIEEREVKIKPEIRDYRYFTARTIDELRRYLEEVAENAADGVAIWDREAERDYDFIDTVHSVLLKYEKQIKNLGWEL